MSEKYLKIKKKKSSNDFGKGFNSSILHLICGD